MPWNQEREAYSKTYADNEGYGEPRRGYGLQDLNYYGGFFYAPGYGYAWQPYRLRQRHARLESLQQWRVDVLSRLRVLVGFSLSLGMAAISLRLVGVHQRRRMGVAARQRLRRSVVRLQLHDRSQDHESSRRLDSAYSSRGDVGNQLRHPHTVLVGKATNTSLSIPGGRIPPDFGSLVPGRTVASNTTAHGFVKPATNVAAKNVFAARPASTQHVFASPNLRPAPSGVPLFEGRPSGAAAVAGVHTSAASAASSASAGGAHK